MRAFLSRNKTVLWQFIKFGFVGVSNTAVSLVIYYVFVYLNKDWYIVGNAVGFFVSVFNAYFWNSRMVFKQREKMLQPLLRSYICYGLTFLLSTGLLYFMVEQLDVSKLLAPILNLFVTTPINFILNKYWVYRKEGNNEENNHS